MFPGDCLPCILVYEPEIDPNVFSLATFHRENNPEKGNEILVWKAEKGSEDLAAQDNTSGRWMFYPTSRTINLERHTDKYYRIVKSHCPTEIREPESAFYFAIKHQQNPGDNIWTKKYPSREERSREAAIESCSKLVRSQNLHFKATRFRCTCGSVAQLSDYQNAQSLCSYNSASIQLQQRMSFALNRLANVVATSEFP